MKKLTIENKLRLSLVFNVMLTLLFLFVGSVSLYLYGINNTNLVYHKIDILNLNEKIDSKDDEIKKLKNNINTIVNDYEELIKSSITLKNDNLSLIYTNEDLNNTIIDLQNRLDKYERYDYAMFDSSGKRNDITYENILLFEELLEDKICNNLDLYLSWIMIESNGRNTSSSPKSTATGLPQFLESTGQFVWKDLLGKEEKYDHYVTAQIAENSIPMMVEFVNYLCINKNGDLDKVIDSYRGIHDVPYLNKFNKFLSYSGSSIESIGKEVKENYDKFKEQNKL